MTQIVEAMSDAHLDDVRTLMLAFVSWHRERHLEDPHLIDQYFDPAAFDRELATLPGAYAPPHGRLLLATCEGAPAGCVALRAIDEVTCEMKRMFVHPHLRGRGIGRALADALIRDARAIGYRSMLLDTSIRQVEARTLYERLGFTVIAPYYELPQAMADWLVFMELPLGGRP